MKKIILITITITTLIICACNTSPESNRRDNVITNIDSCAIALKFNRAEIAESMVDKNYSGELNNYWGDDITKLDFKQVFKNGKLVKIYFYHENQNVQEENSFTCSALHGLQKWYYENGNLAKVIPYSYGYRNGTGLLYDREGNVLQKVIFKNDSIVGEIQTFDKLEEQNHSDSIIKQ